MKLYRRLTMPAFFFGLTIFACSLMELILLEVKYNLFSDGFLQSHQLITASQRVTFIFIFLVLNVVLYGGAFLLWSYLLKKSKVRPNFIAFHFMMLAGIATIVSLIAQFQLHKYFADAMDMALMTQIAGGDIKNALFYVLDEAFLFVVGLAGLILIYFLIYKLIKPFLIKHSAETIKVSKSQGRLKTAGFCLLCLGITAASILIINENENLRYNLNRSNSFSVITSAFDYISDVDRDGYGSFRVPQDNHPFNSGIYPGALDIPNNGIDEDGFFGDFETFIPVTDSIENFKTSIKPKNIVVIMMESTRADIIDKVIDGRLVTPNITNLSHEGQLIDEAYSHTGYTGSSLSSFFSGRIGHFQKRHSLFSILNKHDYQIALFSGQDESWDNIDTKLGTREYADYFYDAQVGIDERVFPSTLPSSIKLSEKTLWEQFKAYSDKLDWNKPTFVYFNMQAGHFPYYHEKMLKNFVKEGIPRSEINSENKEWLRMTYWNAMSHADTYVGKIIAELKEKGVWDDTLVVISGDHGEELFDNGHLGHGFFPSTVQTHIPLVISQRDFNFTEPVGHADMKNLILSYAFNIPSDAQKKTSEKSVFQLIGGLSNPSKIALRYSDEKQIILDLRNMLVRPTGEQEWISYSKAIKNPSVKDDLQKLILKWENLRWTSHLEEENSGAAPDN